MGVNRTGHSSWFWSVLIPLSLVHLFVFLKVPLDIYLSGTAEHSGEPYVVMTILGVACLGSLLVLFLLIFLVFKPVRRVMSCVLIAWALSYWLIDSFFSRTYPSLDGTLVTLPLDGVQLLLELSIPAILFVCLLLARERLNRPSLIFLAVLTVANGAWIVHAFPVPEPASVSRSDKVNGADVFTLSPDKNLLLVLMDTFQSDYFQDYLESDPTQTAGLDGFVYFPDTLGAAPSTFLSLPAIHSGLAYDPESTMSGYFDKAIRRSSIMSRLGENGFHASLVNPIKNLCPEQVSCIDRYDLLHERLETNLGESLYLLDVSLMRSAPEWLRNTVLNKGKFLLSPLYLPGGLGADSRLVWDDSRLLGMLGQKLRSGAVQPRAIFLHLMNTHPPYALDGECQPVQADAQLVRESALQQVACAMRQFSELLASLRDLEVYDNTVIVLLGDHGYSSKKGMADLYSRLADREDSAAARLVGSANPVLLIKPIDAHGPLRTDPRLAALTDLPATVCAALGACEWGSGVDLLARIHETRRLRHFMSYTWEHRFWDLGYIQEADFYRVSGPLGDLKSWEKLSTTLRRKQIAGLEFSSQDDPEQFGSGWGAVEQGVNGPSKRWVTSKQAELFLDLDPDQGQFSAYELSFQVYLPEFVVPQTITLLFNGDLIARQTADNEGIHYFNFRIPAEMVLARSNTVTLVFDRAEGPNSGDLRTLAASFLSLTIQEVVLGSE